MRLRLVCPIAAIVAIQCSLRSRVHLGRHHSRMDRVRHWMMMQLSMVIGFITAIPANAWLIRKGWNEET